MAFVDPRDLPSYTLAEAASYARVRPATARDWICGRPARPDIGRAGQPAIIRPAGKRPVRLSFSNLVELFVLADIRRVHGVPMPRVRAALRFVEGKLGIDRPLIHAEFKTDGLGLFVEHLTGRLGWSKRSPSAVDTLVPTEHRGTAALIEASAGGQLGLREALEQRLDRVEWDAERLAARIFPIVRASASDQPRTIMIDVRMGFGRPVIADTGIRTSIIAQRFRAGESAPALAHDYGVRVDEIEDAVRCEIPTAA